VQSNPLCRTYDTNTGACLTCYDGYYLYCGQCIEVVLTPDNTPPSDLLCAKWNAGVCVQCARTAYFYNGACIQSNPQCRTFNASNGWCTACYTGYVLVKGNCNVAPASAQPAPQLPANFDIYCKTYYSGVCEECFFGFKL